MPLRILVADDNDRNRRMIGDILKYHGYEVLFAVNGEEAVRMARERKPALILMDIRMPVMDGIAATGIIKGGADTRDIKIIGVTSLAMAGDKEAVLLAGADDYISKPINTRDLPARVKKLLGG